MALKSLLSFGLRAGPSRISNRNRNRICTSDSKRVTKCDICKKTVTIGPNSVWNRSLRIFLVFLAKQVLVTIGHNRSQSVTHLKCDWYKPLFLFSVWNPDRTKMKSSKTEQRVTSVSVFCLESGSERLSDWGDSDKNVTASHFVTLILQLVNFWEEKWHFRTRIYIVFSLFHFLSHPSQKTSLFGARRYKTKF